MNPDARLAPVAAIESRIQLLRGQRVMLDADLARLYGVETKALNKAVKRNAKRFPPEFMFQLGAQEVGALRFQSGTSKGRGGRRYRPYAFTQEGIASTPGLCVRSGHRHHCKGFDRRGPPPLERRCGQHSRQKHNQP
jgi:hypothetical protein